MTTTFPTLYKLTSTGKVVQQWTISVDDATITTTYGQVGGAMQTTSDTLTEGKNAGKKNATTPAQQAVAEAKAKWEKQKKARYVEDLAAAQRGEVDDVIEGGVVPMLAKTWEDHGHKVSFPVAVQPKLDGHRCVAVVEVAVLESMPPQPQVTVSLWTRTRKRIKSMPHIEAELRGLVETALANEPAIPWRFVLDGELYNHTYRDRFEDLTSLIRPDEPRPGHDVVEYHVYDVVGDAGFLQRFRTLEPLLSGGSKVKLVETRWCDNEARLACHYDHFKKAGYEGAMVRSLGRGYEHKRSDQLLKMKDFVDAEFKVVRLEEGRGKLQGHVGAFVCVTEDGKEFAAKMVGTTERLREAWLQPEKWIGRRMTVKFQGKTAEGLPRFPSALRLRDEVMS